jgi:hypothetical protein
MRGIRTRAKNARIDARIISGVDIIPSVTMLQVKSIGELTPQ